MTAQRVNPQPAKQAAARAFEAYNLVSFVVGAKQTNTINVGLTLKDARGQALTAVVHGSAYLSDNADGSTLTATATTSALAVGTNGVIRLITVTGKMFDFITNIAGLFDVNLIQTDTTKSYYLCVMMPDGSLAISPIASFA